jgi:alkanesulfonate monooxygenase SsuD/methylene tetrahydromethanopterin reductase-like flavin-dependent oxidoreductase (luciferase family)
VDVGVALPNMAGGWTRSSWFDWCRIVDEGPFRSVSCGERITFRNVEMLTSLAAAAVLTDRVRVMVNLAVAPWHATALLAKQLATIDVMSAGRLDVGLGVGARGQDFEAMGASMQHRHARLDEQVAELRRLWAGESAVAGAPPLGPAPVQAGGPPLYAGALGPKAMARAARWAVGISSFSLNLDVAEIRHAIDLARGAWETAGRPERPRFAVACFFALGDDAAPSTLAEFSRAYFEVFGAPFADAMAELAVLSSPAALVDALTQVASETEVDEVILVPATVDPACASAAAEVVAALPGLPTLPAAPARPAHPPS